MEIDIRVNIKILNLRQIKGYGKSTGWFGADVVYSR